MSKLKHENFKKEALSKPKVKDEYERLKSNYSFVSEIIRARKNANKTQSDVAKIMQTTPSVVSRIEAGGGEKRHSPSLETLKKYARAVGCKLKINLIPIHHKKAFD